MVVEERGADSVVHRPLAVSMSLLALSLSLSSHHPELLATSADNARLFWLLVSALQRDESRGHRVLDPAVPVNVVAERRRDGRCTSSKLYGMNRYPNASGVFSFNFLSAAI